MIEARKHHELPLDMCLAVTSKPQWCSSSVRKGSLDLHIMSRWMDFEMKRRPAVDSTDVAAVCDLLQTTLVVFCEIEPRSLMMHAGPTSEACV